ncbi:FecR family protein [Flavobacteriaceae bacterium F08102]|nr:FecR family protein [Flavobacteriaceae bacterium F08102]
MTPKIENLIVKYITKSANAADLDELSTWIQTPENRAIFKDYVQTHYAITHSLSISDTDKAIDKLLNKIHKEKSFLYRVRTQPIYKYAAAAMVIGIVASTYFFTNNFPNANLEIENPIIINNAIEVGTNKATLELEDGTAIELTKGKTFKTTDAKSTGDALVYEHTSTTPKKITKNTLTIPRGGQYKLVLADGTNVWLNSESKLIYPTRFEEGKARNVNLVYGEAYFEVSPSEAHAGATFNVNHKMQNIQVLGTHFNVKAYQNESKIYTTLAEGKVKVIHENGSQNLMPNQQSILNLAENTLSVVNVDVYNEIAWKDGVFTFENKSLVEIMTALSRWYDMEFIFKDPTLKSQKFIGNINKNFSIVEILTTLQSTNIIHSFEINNKTVTLK